MKTKLDLDNERLAAIDAVNIIENWHNKSKNEKYMGRSNYFECGPDAYESFRKAYDEYMKKYI